MQALLASLVVSMSVKDSAYKAGMASARAEAKKTGQDLEKSADTMAGAMERAAESVNRAMVRVVDSIAAAGEKARNAGLALTAGLTIPLGLAGNSARQTAATFEAAMNRVRTAMVDAPKEQIDELAAAAQRLGPAAGKSAIEAAAAIEVLAKNGLSASSILNGALESSLTLSTIGAMDLAASADLTTDVMQQFGKTASDLPQIVDQITGALDASKLSADDYRLAIGQAGGVAGGLGYSFEDLNVVLAATASSFGSGSDAGTSFKTFLTSLVPQSQEAARVMKVLDLEFFNLADGSAKSLSEVTEELNTKMSNLSDSSRTSALKTLFGSDAMRTANALMKLGSEGLQRISDQIDAIRAQDKLEIIQEGDAAATLRLSAAMEKLAIQFGNVLLPITTAMKNAIAGLVNTIASAPRWFFDLAAGVALAASAVGPLIIALLGLSKLVLPLLALRLGAIPFVIAAIVNPVGVVIRLVAQLAIHFGIMTAATRVLGLSIGALAGPIGLVISLLTILTPLMLRKTEASKRFREAQEAENAATAEAEEVIQQLITAEGKALEMAVAKARADRDAAKAAVDKSRADLIAARAAVARAQAEAAAMASTASFATGSAAGLGASGMVRGRGDQRVTQARANEEVAAANLSSAVRRMASLEQHLASAEARLTPGGTINPDFSKPERERRGRTPRGRDALEDEQRFARELADMQDRYLSLQLDLETSSQAAQAIEVDRLNNAKAAYDAEVENRVRQGELTRTRADALKTQNATNAELELQLIQARHDSAGAQHHADVQAERIDAETTLLRLQEDAARTQSDRRRIRLQLLDLEEEEARIAAEAVLARRDSTEREKELAEQRLRRLEAEGAARREAINRDTATPMEAYLLSLNASAEEINEAIEGINVGALGRLNTELTDAFFGVGSLAGAFSNLWKNVLRGLGDIAVQMYIIKPLANSLFGGGGGGGFLSGLGSMLGGAVHGKGTAGGVLSYGGGKRSGGRVSPGSWYMVGEDGPEPFVPDSAGTIIPNGGLRGSRGPAVVQLVVGEGQLFEPRVTSISGGVTVQTVTRRDRYAALRGRQQLA